MKHATLVTLASALLWSHAAFACGLPDNFSLMSAYPGAVPSPNRINGDMSFTLPGSPLRKVDPKGTGVVCKAWKHKPDLTLMAVKLVKQGVPQTTSSDFEILLLDTATGAIRHRLPSIAEPDPEGFVKTFHSFDLYPYSMVPAIPTFGVSTARVRDLKGATTVLNTLTLYVYANDQPQRVLEMERSTAQIPPYAKNGRTQRVTRNLKPLPVIHNGLNDLEVTVRQSVDYSLSDDEGNSKYMDETISSKSYVLQFDGSMYRAVGPTF